MPVSHPKKARRIKIQQDDSGSLTPVDAETGQLIEGVTRVTIVGVPGRTVLELELYKTNDKGFMMDELEIVESRPCKDCADKEKPPASAGGFKPGAPRLG